MKKSIKKYSFDVNMCYNKKRGVVDMKQVVNIKGIRNKRDILNRKIEEKLLKSEEDYKKGRVKNITEVFREWKEKYGI